MFICSKHFDNEIQLCFMSWGYISTVIYPYFLHNSIIKRNDKINSIERFRPQFIMSWKTNFYYQIKQKISFNTYFLCRVYSVINRAPDFCTFGPRFESRTRHKCITLPYASVRFDNGRTLGKNSQMVISFAKPSCVIYRRGNDIRPVAAASHCPWVQVIPSFVSVRGAYLVLIHKFPWQFSCYLC